MTLTKFGFHFASTSYDDVDVRSLFARIAEVAAAAEFAGFDSIWVPDHVHQNRIGGGPGGPMLEAYTLLAALAIKTDRVLLGSLVSPVTFREPALLAKVITTLDVISGGRAVLGIGAWDTDEHQAYGFEFPGTGEREDRLEEALQVCREMFTTSPATFDGRYYQLHDAFNAPRPVQSRIPILVGGGGEKRTLAAAAKYGDACNFFGAPDVVLHKLEVLAEHCATIGRDVGTEISTTCALFAPETTAELVDQVGQRLAVGVEGAVIFGGTCPSAELVSEWGAALHQAFD